MGEVLAKKPNLVIFNIRRSGNTGNLDGLGVDPSTVGTDRMREVYFKGLSRALEKSLGVREMGIQRKEDNVEAFPKPSVHSSDLQRLNCLSYSLVSLVHLFSF